MAEYYVIKDKNTGLYFRGKGVNRWGKHYNQASIYRVKGMAEHSIKEIAWHGEQAEVVPIQIFENTDVAPRSEVASEIFTDIEHVLYFTTINGKQNVAALFEDYLEVYKKYEATNYGR